LCLLGRTEYLALNTEAESSLRTLFSIKDRTIDTVHDCGKQNSLAISTQAKYTDCAAAAGRQVEGCRVVSATGLHGR
jgi:hypothetical protein